MNRLHFCVEAAKAASYWLGIGDLPTAPSSQQISTPCGRTKLYMGEYSLIRARRDSLNGCHWSLDTDGNQSTEPQIINYTKSLNLSESSHNIQVFFQMGWHNKKSGQLDVITPNKISPDVKVSTIKCMEGQGSRLKSRPSWHFLWWWSKRSERPDWSIEPDFSVLNFGPRIRCWHKAIGTSAVLPSEACLIQGCFCFVHNVFLKYHPDLIIQNPFSASDIWWPSQERCSNSFTSEPPLLTLLLTCGGY